MLKKYGSLLLLILALTIWISPKKVETQSTLPWGVSQLSLDNATGTATGTAFALISNPAAFVEVVVDITGTVTSNTILLEGSLDNSSWFTLATSTVNTDHSFKTTTAVKFVRPRVSAHGGGGGTTDISLIAKGNFTTAYQLFTGGSVTGDLNLVNGAELEFGGDNIWTRVADGKIQYAGLANTSPMILLGGSTSSFPAWKRNATILEARLADDSANAPIRVSTFQTSGSIQTGASFNRTWQAASNVTIASGFGTSPSIVTNGTYGVEVTVGTGGADSSGTITLSAANTGWNCYVNNQTTTSATVFMTKQTASTTTSATFTNYTNAAAAAAWVAGDKLKINCFGY